MEAQEIVSAIRENLTEQGFTELASNWCNAHFVKGDVDVELMTCEGAVRIFVAINYSRTGWAMAYSHAMLSGTPVHEVLERAMHHANDMSEVIIRARGI